jgi:hypothetical protein
MVLVGSSVSISSAALKAPDKGGMAGPGDADGTRRLNSLNSATAIAMTTNSMFFYS